MLVVLVNSEVNEILWNIDVTFLIAFHDYIINYPLNVIEFASSIIAENIFSLPDKAGYLVASILVFLIGAGAGLIIEKVKRKE